MMLNFIKLKLIEVINMDQVWAIIVNNANLF